MYKVPNFRKLSSFCDARVHVRTNSTFAYQKLRDVSLSRKGHSNIQKAPQLKLKQPLLFSKFFCTETSKEAQPAPTPPKGEVKKVAEETVIISTAKAPMPVLALGTTSLFPFVACAGLEVYYGQTVEGAFTMFLHMTYSACFLSFVSAVNFGVAVSNYSLLPAPADPRQDLILFGTSPIPAMMAWLSLSSPPLYGMAGLTLGFTSAFITDASAYFSGRTPGWWFRLRFIANIVAMTSLGIAVATVPNFVLLV